MARIQARQGLLSTSCSQRSPLTDLHVGLSQQLSSFNCNVPSSMLESEPLLVSNGAKHPGGIIHEAYGMQDCVLRSGLQVLEAA